MGMYGLLNGNFIFDRWGRLYTGVCNCKHSELYCILGQWGGKGAYISFLRRPVEAADWIIIIKWDIVLEDNYLLCFCFTVLTDRIIGIDHRYRMIRQIDVFFFQQETHDQNIERYFFYQFTNHLFFKFALVLRFYCIFFAVVFWFCNILSALSFLFLIPLRFTLLYKSEKYMFCTLLMPM